MFTRVKRMSAVALAISLVATPAIAVTGSQGESLTVSQSKAIKSGSTIIVTGQHYDETVGIYVAFCKVVPKGELPTPCGGGADKSGAAGASQWISSNPPPYGAIDCKKVKCAIYTRADHTRGDDRSFDLFIPVTFK